MSFLLLASLLLAPLPPTATVIVVDAGTRLPLAGVTVRNLEALLSVSPVITDGAGRFEHPRPGLHVQLSRLGYAPKLVNRDLKTSTVPDTVVLEPASVALGEVSVRPGKVLLLESNSTKGARIGRTLSPGQLVAVQLVPPAGQSCQVDMMRFILAAKTHEGRIRVRLLNAIPGGPYGHPQPGTTELLAEPILISNERLVAAKKGYVQVDLSPYNLTLPVEGVFVVLETLATNPADKPVTITQPASGRGKLTVVLSTNPDDLTTSHTLDMDTYPTLAGLRGEGTPTYSWFNSRPGWKELGGASTNVHIELSVRAN